MNIETVREYCLSKPCVTEAFPFDDETMVFRVGDSAQRPGKIFVLCSLSCPDYLLMKCDPDWAIELRDRYPGEVEAGWHMNKRHWNGVFLTGPHLTDGDIRGMIDYSYSLVVRGFSGRYRAMLGL